MLANAAAHAILAFSPALCMTANASAITFFATVFDPVMLAKVAGQEIQVGAKIYTERIFNTGTGRCFDS